MALLKMVSQKMLQILFLQRFLEVPLPVHQPMPDDLVCKRNLDNIPLWQRREHFAQNRHPALAHRALCSPISQVGRGQRNW